MSTKRKGRSGEPTAPEATDKPIELVVRRGALWRFNTLKKKTADLPVTVMWDRRQGERRAGSDTRTRDRRGADRRQQPPFTWEVADFVVVGPVTPGGTPAKGAAVDIPPLPPADNSNPGRAARGRTAVRSGLRARNSRSGPQRGPKVPRKKKS